MTGDFGKFKAALTLPGLPLYHNEAFEEEGDYIVWAETTKLYTFAGCRAIHSGWRVAVDLFTREEYGAEATIEAALSAIGILVSDCQRIYEPETGYTHYAFTAEVWDIE